MAYYDKIDGDTLLATLQRQNGVTLEGNHGVQFVRPDLNYPPKYVGFVTNDKGVVMPARFFYRVEPWQMDHARKLVAMLNKELYHDGAWAVLWTAPGADGVPKELRMAWQDCDGDVCFIVESKRELLDIMTNGPESHLENCEKAFKEYQTFMCEVDVKNDQKIKSGQGQQQFDPSITLLI